MRVEVELIMSWSKTFYWESILFVAVSTHLDPTRLAFIWGISFVLSEAESTFVFGTSIFGSLGSAGPEESMISVWLMSSKLSTVSSFYVKLFITKTTKEICTISTSNHSHFAVEVISTSTTRITFQVRILGNVIPYFFCSERFESMGVGSMCLGCFYHMIFVRSYKI